MDARTRPPERRIVSVLFADLVGFTTLAEGLDPEDLATIQDAYFSTVREVIGRYRGSLEKFIGDAAMAVFGTPRAEDDDAVRAVQAGLALVHAVGDLGARLGLEGSELRLRVGVNTGEVLVATGGPDEGRVSGDTVNVAARLQTAAEPGGVLVGELTGLSVAHAVELEAVEPLALKGKTRPVAASRVVGLHPEPSRDLAMGRLRAPMLGRDDELARLRGAAESASDGDARRVLVVAPPGVGKTRLLEAVAEELGGGGWRVIRGRVGPGGSAFDAIGRLVRAALTRDGAASLDLDEALTRIAAALERGRAEVVVRDIRSLLGPAAEAASRERSGLFASWIDAIDATGDGRPQAWLIEDLHWAGGDLLAFLDAAAATPGARRLIVGTARPSLLDRLAVPADEGPVPGAPWDIVHLPTLTPDACGRVLAALAGDALPASLAARVVARSDGNCLFVEELLRSWASAGLLVHEDGAWRLTVDPADVPLPATVQAIYAAQLDDLPPVPRAVVRRGAVAGRRFPTAALDPLGVPVADEALATLRRRAILNGPLPPDLLGEAHAFRHALLRDAGYASLGRAERADLHVALARWLESVTGERVAEVGGEIGRHYGDALVAAPALAVRLGGLERAEVAALAARWLEAAADRDRARFASAAAAEGYRRVIGLTPAEDHLALASLNRRLGQATAPDDLDRAIEAYETAIREARAALADPASPAARDGAVREELARAAAGASAGRYEQIRFADALAIADDALAVLGEAPEAARVAIARIRAREGLDNDYAGLALEARDVERRVLAQGGDPAIAFEARRTALALEAGTGDAAATAWAALGEEAASLGRTDVAVGALVNGATIAFDTDRQAAFAQLDRAEELAEQFALFDRLGWIGMTRTELWLATGDWDRASAAGLAAVRLGTARAFHRVVVRTMSALTPIAHARRDLATLRLAATWFERWRTIFPGSPYGTVLHLAVDLRLADVGLGPEPAPDEERLAAGLGLADDSPSWLAAVEQIVRSRIAAGDVAGARWALDRYDVPLDAPVAPRRDASVALCRAWVLGAEGRRDDARAAAADALAAAERDAIPWWILRALETADDPSTTDRRRALARSLGLAAAARAAAAPAPGGPA